jgi:hypothetical protein
LRCSALPADHLTGIARIHSYSECRALFSRNEVILRSKNLS